MQGAALLTINCPLHPITGVTPTPPVTLLTLYSFPITKSLISLLSPSHLTPSTHIPLAFIFHTDCFVSFLPSSFCHLRHPYAKQTLHTDIHLSFAKLCPTDIFTFSPQLRVGLFTPQMLTSWVPPELCLMLKGRNARAMRIRLWGGVGERTKLEKKRGRTKHSSNS